MGTIDPDCVEACSGRGIGSGRLEGLYRKGELLHFQILKS